MARKTVETETEVAVNEEAELEEEEAEVEGEEEAVETEEEVEVAEEEPEAEPEPEPEAVVTVSDGTKVYIVKNFRITFGEKLGGGKVKNWAFNEGDTIVDDGSTCFSSGQLEGMCREGYLALKPEEE